MRHGYIGIDTIIGNVFTIFVGHYKKEVLADEVLLMTYNEQYYYAYVGSYTFVQAFIKLLHSYVSPIQSD